jgi:hypothetical protein
LVTTLAGVPEIGPFSFVTGDSSMRVAVQHFEAAFAGRYIATR